MSEYQKTISIHADPERVFAYVSDIANLPDYLPTVHRAEKQQGERVRVQGEHKYDSDGMFKVNQASRRLDWGSDGENNYKGWLQVNGGSGQADVTVHISFEPKPEIAQRMEEQAHEMGGHSRDDAMNEGIETALQSIKNQVEGNGGKIESSGATQSS